MNLEDILAIHGRIGTENKPTAAELDTAQKDLARAIHTEATSAGPDLAVLTTLKGALTEVTAALTDEVAAEAAAQAQIADLIADVPNPDALVATDPEPVVAADPEPVDPDPAPVDPEPADDKVLVGAVSAASTLSLREAAARVRTRPVEPIQLPSGLDSGSQIWLSGQQINHAPDLREMAGAFERITRSPSTGKQTLVRFDSLLDKSRVLPGDTNGNTAMITDLIGPEAVAAAGGCCSLPTPIREQNVLSSARRPLRDALPAIGVMESGAVTYFPAICLPQAGAALWTCTQDENVDFEDPDTWKPCAHIECATAQTTIVQAIYRCMTIGEFQRRFATEQWTGVIQAVLAEQARIAEQAIWAQMIAGVTTTHNGFSTGSIFANIVQTVQLAADTIRQDQRYLDVTLRWFAPSWVPGAIASDFATRRLEFADPSDVRPILDRALRNAGVEVTYSPDSQIIETGDQPDDTDPLTPYPDYAYTILAPEGYYSFLDGGQFDLGIEIRDLNLARQNAVAAFAESFEGVLARGCNAKRLNIPVGICNNAAGCIES